MKTADTVTHYGGRMPPQEGHMDKEQRERKIFVSVAGTLLVCLLTYGASLIVYQNLNAKKRAGLPQTITLLQQ